MKKMMFAMFTFVSMLSFSFAVDCPMQFMDQGQVVCAQLKWLEGPYLGRNSSFEVTFWNKNDQDKELMMPKSKVDIYTWMVMDNGHHHKGPAITLRSSSVPSIRVPDAKFFMGSMKGFWQVKVVLDADSSAAQVQSVNVNF